jgi:hypothetical protein
MAMNKFKGTKGTWLNKFNGCYFDVYRKEDHEDGRSLAVSVILYESNPNVVGVNNISKLDECKANALLISKAPEMLEMLEKISLVLDNFNPPTKETALNWSNEIKQLIKEATEL